MRGRLVVAEDDDTTGTPLSLVRKGALVIYEVVSESSRCSRWDDEP